MFWNSNSTKMNPWISIFFLIFKYYNVLTFLPSPPTFFLHFFHTFCLSFLPSLHSKLHTPRTPIQFMFIVFIEQYGLHNPWTLFLHINSCQLYSSMVHALCMPFDYIHWNSIFVLVCACFAHAFCIFVFSLTIFSPS